MRWKYNESNLKTKDDTNLTIWLNTWFFFPADVLEAQLSRQYLLASSALDGRLILWSQDAKLASVAPESKKDPAAPKDTNPFKDLYAAKRMTLTTEHIVINIEIILCYICQIMRSR